MMKMLDFRDWVTLAGLAFLALGLGLIYVPGAFIGVGLLLLYLGVWGIKPNGPASTA